MIWTKRDLINVLSQYKDDDVLVGELWTKLDVEYNLADIDPSYENISQDRFDKFDVDKFWDEYQDELEGNFDHSISENNMEMFYAIQRHLQEEVD
jgi:hypothetical protein